MKKPECGFVDCHDELTPKAAKVGYTIGKEQREVIVCERHAFLIMSSPRGSYEITEEPRLKPIPAVQIFTK